MPYGVAMAIGVSLIAAMWLPWYVMQASVVEPKKPWIGPEEANNLYPFFDEARYLIDNQDVRNAVKRGVIESGLVHFANYGHKEGRRARWDIKR